MVFEDTAAATNALKQMQGFPFFEKPLKIEFAKHRNSYHQRKAGTWLPREKRKAQEAEIEAERSAAKKQATESGNGDAPAPMDDSSESAAADDRGDGGAPPNKILFTDSLPADCTQDALEALCKAQAGFVEVRMPKKGLAFVEYQDEMQAGLALRALNGFKLTPTAKLEIGFAKK